MISEFSKVSGNKIHYEIVERRDGDIAFSVADISKKKKYYLGLQKTIK